jgi:peptidoglycan DL-endopeptidase CwlO
VPGVALQSRYKYDNMSSMAWMKSWRLVAFPVVSIAVLAVSVPAGASPADDKRAEVARIAKDTEALIRKGDQLNEKSKATKFKLDEVSREVSVAEVALARRSAEVSSLTGAVTHVVVKSYVYGEQDQFSDLLGSLEGTPGSNASARDGYSSVLVGSATDKVDELRAARQDAERLSRDLTDRQTRLTNLAAQLKTEKEAVVKTEAELAVLATKVTGELAQLVAEETRKRAEAEAARARAEAEAQRKELARRAEQQRQALVAKAAADQAVRDKAVRDKAVRDKAAREAAARNAAARNAPTPALPRVVAPVPVQPPPIDNVPRPPAPNPGAAIAVAEALRQLGKPYVWGTNGPNTFDCSGLTQWAWGKAGIFMDHYTGSQAYAFPRVSPDRLQPGDLVFFNVDLGHMGMYIGNGQIVQAPRTGDVVKITSLNLGNVVVAVRPG